MFQRTGIFRSIRWRIAVPYTFLVLAAVIAPFVYFSNLVYDAYLDQLRSQLTAQARLVADGLSDALGQGEPRELLNRRAHHYAETLGARVTIIAADGTVLGESHLDPAEMDNHLYRPEVQQALLTGVGSSIRYSNTVGYQMMYAAAPARFDGRTIGFVRVSLSLRQIDADVARLRQTIVVTTLLAAAGATLLAVLIAERTARPVRELTELAGRLAEGDMSVHLLPTTLDEVGALTRAFNQMVRRLRATIITLTEERGRFAAVLENMADGAIITDGDGRVRLVNPSAARILRIRDVEDVLGRTFAETARDHRIIKVWERCRAEGEEQIESVEIGRSGPFLQVIVTPLWDDDPLASLVILQDLTRVRRLEAVRRDFVSNISHELRTPLASLKALVDTLRDGALDDPPAAERFLDRMETELDALTQMVRELLELSRIESGQVPLCKALISVAEVVTPSVERLIPQAERAGLRLTLHVPSDLPPVEVDAERMQQALTNLVHNAIKFTPPGGEISVRANVHGGDLGRPKAAEAATTNAHPAPWLLISVEDTGVGIPADDLPRIFERFYKADRARSGGGTGLGLSIAKHIVQAHGGRIWAESVEGAGATFFVALPI